MSYVPGEYDQDRTDGDLPNEALEALLRLSIGVLKNILANLDQVVAPLNSCGN